MWITSLVFILLCVLEETASEYCDSILKYCSGGCCGSMYDEYCCYDGLNGVQITFIVIGTVVTVGAVIACVCCCVRQKGYAGSVFNRQPAQTTFVGGQPLVGGQPTLVGGQTTFIQGQNGYIGSQPGYVISSPANVTVVQTSSAAVPGQHMMQPPAYGTTVDNYKYGPAPNSTFSEPPPPYPGQ